MAKGNFNDFKSDAKDAADWGKKAAKDVTAE